MTSIMGRCLVRLKLSLGRRRCAIGVTAFPFTMIRSEPEFLGQMIAPKLQRVILMNHNLLQKVSIESVWLRLLSFCFLPFFVIDVLAQNSACAFTQTRKIMLFSLKNAVG